MAEENTVYERDGVKVELWPEDDLREFVVSTRKTKLLGIMGVGEAMAERFSDNDFEKMDACAFERPERPMAWIETVEGSLDAAGKEALLVALDMLDELGVKEVWATSSKQNFGYRSAWGAKLVKFYEKVGFVRAPKKCQEETETVLIMRFR